MLLDRLIDPSHEESRASPTESLRLVGVLGRSPDLRAHQAPVSELRLTHGLTPTYSATPSPERRRHGRARQQGSCQSGRVERSIPTAPSKPGRVLATWVKTACTGLATALERVRVAHRRSDRLQLHQPLGALTTHPITHYPARGSTQCRALSRLEVPQRQLLAEDGAQPGQISSDQRRVLARQVAQLARSLTRPARISQR